MEQGQRAGGGGNGRPDEPDAAGRGGNGLQNLQDETPRPEGGAESGGLDRFLGGGGGAEWGGGGWRGPITGDNFREWSDRLRSVEDMLQDDALRSDTARIRDRATDARREFRRDGGKPDWNKLQDLVAEPLNELSRRIGEEIRRREAPDSLVPIDRDPVPPEYAEQVRQYYERVGAGD
jgi:hypothetical protein